MKIAIISGSRADWSGLGMLAVELKLNGCDVRVIALSESPVAAIRADGFLPVKGWRSEYPTTTLAIIHDDFGRAGALEAILRQSGPDMAVVCGDRHEIMVAAYVAAMMGLPLAHLAGGDLSGGSLDERWRHAITKIADVHFPTNDESAVRIIRMGERPDRVHSLGSPAIDRLLSVKLFSRNELLMALGLPHSLIEGGDPFILANWQPETPIDAGLPQVLDALDIAGLPVVFVGANAEPGSEEANRLVARWAKARQKPTVIFPTLPLKNYLSALQHCLCLVGNSSSGFYEAPYFGTPVINVGDRQRGRWAPRCVYSTIADADLLAEEVEIFRASERQAIEQPYGDGHAAPAIALKLMEYMDRPSGWHLGKLFHDL